MDAHQELRGAEIGPRVQIARMAPRERYGGHGESRHYGKNHG
jgi:hypothetical protein